MKVLVLIEKAITSRTPDVIIGVFSSYELANKYNIFERRVDRLYEIKTFEVIEEGKDGKNP